MKVDSFRSHLSRSASSLWRLAAGSPNLLRSRASFVGQASRAAVPGGGGRGRLISESAVASNRCLTARALLALASAIASAWTWMKVLA